MSPFPDILTDHHIQTVIGLALILAVAVFAFNNQTATTQVKEITHDEQLGNVATTSVYTVYTDNNVSYQYKSTSPTAGSLCNTTNPKDCNQSTDPGYTTIQRYTNQLTAVDNRSDRKRYLPSSTCISNANSTHISIHKCK